jgi:hypothetical protein
MVALKAPGISKRDDEVAYHCEEGGMLALHLTVYHEYDIMDLRV